MGNQQPKVSESERGWFAGFFDGEGSVILTIRVSAGKNGGPKIQPLAKIAGTDTQSLDALTAIMDRSEIAYYAKWYQPKGYMRDGTAYKRAWDITIAGHKRCKRFYQWITPYLVAKRERAELMLDYIDAREAHSDFRTPITESELTTALQMRALNMKGKAKPFTKAMMLNTERPGASSEKLAANGIKGALARWGVRD